VATAILAFEGDGRVVRYGGNYSTYRKLKAEAEQRAKEEKDAQARASKAAPAKAASPEAGKAAEPKKKGLTYGERLELESIMDKIEAAEARVAETEAALADPDLFAKRGHEVPQRTKDADDAKRALDAIMARWEDLESRKA
jgi:ATP-binding cassette subfamily F protein uup